MAVTKSRKSAKTAQRGKSDSSQKKGGAAQGAEENGKALDYKKILEFYGLVVEETTGNNVKGDCPLCGKEGHFFMSKATGQWDCKVCLEKGNIYTFLGLLHRVALASTTKGEYASLSKHRNGLPAEFLKSEQLAFYMGKWMLPSWNANGAISNLHLWEGPGKPIYGAPGLSLHLIRMPELTGSPAANNAPDCPVYVAEGFWDTYSLAYVLSKSKQKGIAVGTPGSGTFKTDWLEHFRNRNVYLLFDNDTSGEKGMAKIASMLQGYAKEVRILHWPADTFVDGYDLNDYFAERSWKPIPAFKILQSMTTTYHVTGEQQPMHVNGTPIPSANLNPNSLRPPLAEELIKAATAVFGKPQKGKAPVPTFKTLIKELKKEYHLDDNMIDAYAVTYATILSVKLANDCPLWTFISGPPGCGKTMALMTASYYEGCFYASTLTPASLVSGYITDDGSDPSMIPHLINKSLIVKDYTAIKSLPMSYQEELYGVLRDAYDGRVDKMFGNGRHLVFDPCYFSLVAGVTHVIHGDNRASLGERFLKYEFIRTSRGAHYNSEEHIRAAVRSAERPLEVDQRIRVMVSHFLESLANLKDWSDPKNLPKCPEWVVNRIVNLSQIVAFLRCGENPEYRPQPEIGTRLAKQLIKLGRALCVVYGKPAIDQDVYRVMEQCAFDTSIGWNSDIIRTLLEQKSAMTLDDLLNESAVSKATLERKIGSLLEIRAISRHRPKATNSVGRPPMEYAVSPHIRDLYAKAKLK